MVQEIQGMVSGLGMELGTGAVIGFVSGFAAKKVTKLVAILVGGALLVAKWLESQGHISVDWTGVGGGFLDVGTAAAEAAPSMFDAVVSTLGLGGGFVAGFYLGFRRG
ncbi:MAG: FUN14 domain-containing protein [Candidatus Nanohaloarchaea archaeon]|nr:FUN14 domain-containing protein [Candidatus Nanohaloarchaea archaeon]